MSMLKFTYTDTPEGGHAAQTINGIPIIAVVEDTRVLLKDRLPGYTYYELRHADNDYSQPFSIETDVRVNFWGTLILVAPIVRNSQYTKIFLRREQREWLMWKASEIKHNERRVA